MREIDKGFLPQGHRHVFVIVNLGLSCGEVLQMDGAAEKGALLALD